MRDYDRLRKEQTRARLHHHHHHHHSLFQSFTKTQSVLSGPLIQFSYLDQVSWKCQHEASVTKLSFCPLDILVSHGDYLIVGPMILTEALEKSSKLSKGLSWSKLFSGDVFSSCSFPRHYHNSSIILLLWFVQFNLDFCLLSFHSQQLKSI